MRRRDLIPITLIVIALVLIVGERIGGVARLSGWLADGTSRVQGVTTRVLRSLSNARVFFEDLEALRAENAALRARTEDLTVQLVALDEVIAENTILRTELGFVETQRGLRVMGAHVQSRVLGSDPTNFTRAIVISTGQDGSLLPDMPVLTGRGLVGRVVEVWPRSALVLLLNDGESAVGCLIQRSRATGIARGQLDGSLIMQEVPRDADVQVGDIVLTSGLGDVFPKGIVIGQVSEVLRSDTAMFQQAVVSPSVDLSALEVVLVLLEHTEDLEP